MTARPYAGQTPEERDAERTRRLLAAERELFGTIGYAATSVERICTEAKVSTRHFYQLYENKEALFVAVYQEINDQSFALVLDSLAESAGEPMNVRIPSALNAYFAPMIADVRAARIAFVEMMGISPQMEERRLTRRESLVAFIEAEGAAAVERGETTTRDFRFAALALSGAANTVVFDWASRETPGDLAEFEGKLADLAITLLAR
ncbi:MAG: hypothetical protein JWQ74_1616 [Marmoricola sp.]|nr:hypothetical protein [Marmoricola sp.]